MARDDLNAPELFINRELSWLEFNDRVLREGLREDLPLLERLKFLAIVSSNLDEFFMIRVAGLMQQRSADIRRRDPSGLSPSRQIALIAARTHRMVAEQTAGITDVLARLAREGLSVLAPAEWTEQQRRFLRSHFAAEIQPVLTPLAVQDLDPPPLLPGLQLNVGLLLNAGADGIASAKIAVVPVPSQFPRFITIPSDAGVNLARLEDVIAANAGMLFGRSEVLARAVFRITRDADVAIQDDEAADLLHTVEEAVLARRRRAAVRLAVSADPHPVLRGWLRETLGLHEEDIYEIDGVLDAAALMEIANRPGFDAHKVPDWSPQPPEDLVGTDDLWSAVQDHDVLLHHPYESFDPVVKFIEAAADDPGVLALKQTLYRTSGESPIIAALARAAGAGKEVTVLVELKARFDEARNVHWARRLEDEGCHVIYGIAGLKTHAKVLLIVRREAGRIRRYVHVSTGNYNDRTARLYCDIGMLTCDNDFAADAAGFFNLLTGQSEITGFAKLSMAPTGLRQRFTELIDREIRASTPDRPGLIMAKLNSLEDKGICQALYRAARAGVEVRLNVRGLCCLRPGVPGVSEDIEVRSIVDRFLEHARIFYFRNGGHEETYLSSADWMGRNLDKRLEILFPVSDPRLQRRLIGILETCFADNTNSYLLQSDGTYRKVPPGRPVVRAQETFYLNAVEAARAAGRTQQRFRPLGRPED